MATIWSQGSLNSPAYLPFISGGPPPTASQSFAWPSLQAPTEPLLNEALAHTADSFDYPNQPRVPGAGHGQPAQHNAKAFEYGIKVMELKAMNRDLRRRLNRTKGQLADSHQAIRCEVDLLSDFLEGVVPFVDGYQAFHLYFKYIEGRVEKVKQLIS